MIEATLETVSLNDRPDFIALSYVWGQIDTRKHNFCDFNILINGELAVIRTNLGLALHGIRKNTSSKIQSLKIWVDAICINQEDPVEKAWQIGLMSAIYRQAASTLICLDGQETQHAVRMIGALTQTGFLREMKVLEALARTRDAHPRERRMPRSEHDGLTAVSTPSKFEKLLVQLRELLSHPWWGRRWVVQEAFFSRNPLVYDGTQVVSLDKFADLASWYASYIRASRYVPGSVEGLFDRCPFYPLLRCWKAYRRDPSVHRAPLPRWMALTCRFSQSLPRDMVFALLSLSSARDQLNIKPDYASADDVVFRNVYAHLIQTYGFDCLRSKLSTNLPDPQLPSWCRRWSARFNAARLVPFTAEPDKPEFRACSDTTEVSWFTDDEATDSTIGLDHGSQGLLSKFSGVLAIRGLVFDEVAIAIPTGLCDDSMRDMSIVSIEELFREAVSEWVRWLGENKNDPYDKGCGRSVATTLTLLGNQTGLVPNWSWDTMRIAWMKQGTGKLSSKALENKPKVGEGLFYERARLLCFNRSLIATTRGFVGLAPLKTRRGDTTAIFHGSIMPQIIRNDDRSGFHDLIGETYIHGIMHGEATGASAGSDLVDFFIQ
jgi:hypothetical protein